VPTAKGYLSIFGSHLWAKMRKAISYLRNIIPSVHLYRVLKRVRIALILTLDKAILAPVLLLTYCLHYDKILRLGR